MLVVSGRHRALRSGQRVALLTVGSGRRLALAGSGQFSVENLSVVDAVEAMRFRAEMAAQIQDLPEGATVKLEAGE